ncbi:hypothetical protein IGB42_02322 [Andreprevotia sp. IGB-42]|uniref:flagellar FliJ family protein n=1 Tax=Andreprevotia sp. IGB-42 TaxID=2497473 RepID=UPI001357C3C2|nr:flagellar FliJ family protein [Andreprevotia sp. IGB-42]KAF0813393.1 hypothetical protein IGB42_02322 [Andreprevotia sp. IGB-42]
MNTRQFQYALRPVHTLTEWDLAELRQNLAELVVLESEREKTLAAAAQDYHAAESAMRAGHAANALVDPARQRQWHQYLGHLDRSVVNARVALEEATRLKEAALNAVAEKHAFLKGLETHRDSLFEIFTREMHAREAKAMDEAWLQSAAEKKAS